MVIARDGVVGASGVVAKPLAKTQAWIQNHVLLYPAAADAPRVQVSERKVSSLTRAQRGSAEGAASAEHTASTSL
eukprot:15455318-Alexandrium_andersonii.AAC.1